MQIPPGCALGFLRELTEDYEDPKHAGAQSSFSYKGGSSATQPSGLTIFTGTLKSPHGGYRVTVSGSNVKLSITTGTSDRKKTERVFPPARFVAGGTVTVYAEADDLEEDAEAIVRVERVTAAEPPDVAGFEDSTSGPVTLQPSIVAFRALTACTLTIRGAAVSLTAGQAVELRGPASLDAGIGTPLYEP